MGEETKEGLTLSGLPLARMRKASARLTGVAEVRLRAVRIAKKVV